MRMFLLMLLSTMIASTDDDTITEISLSRWHSYGSGPNDDVVLRSDGSAEYTGRSNVQRRGKHTGKVEIEDFERLGKLIKTNKFFDMKDDYVANVEDELGRMTGVKRGDKSKRVQNYGDVAPKEMREIEDEIIKIMEKIEWKRDEAKPPASRP